MVVVESGVRHTKRLEDILLGVPSQGLSASALDDQAEHPVTGVAVEMAFAGSEVQFSLAFCQLQYVVHTVRIVESAAGETHQLPSVAQSAGMVDKVTDRDRGVVIGQLGQVLADTIV